MNDDTLWDGKGRDEVVEKVGQLLRPAAFSEARSPMPSLAPRTRRPGRTPWIPSLLLAAAAILLVVGLTLTRPAEKLPERTTPEPLAADRTIDLGRYGEVRAEAGAVLREIRRTDEEIRLRLERGTIHASITLEARPRLFQVETPATTCVDLGCHYTLTVDAAGRTLVQVETGRVAFQNGPREVFIPAGATCRAEPATGSGTPHWDDAPAALVAAIRAYDTAPPARRQAAALALCRAGPRREDALTLWHLLQDDDARVREAALDTLEAAAGRPELFSREETLARDARALEAWKAHLELDPFR